jgi:hypothetical protein
MDQKSNQYRETFSDDDHDLFERQAVLLNGINSLVRSATIDNRYNTDDIHSLKQEYNHMANTRAKLARISLSDPMEALPPELWPYIIKNTIAERENSTDKLLDLVSVSKGWFSTLVTLPVIWTTVRLDQSEADYLAKAMTCIQLSGECEIDLHIYHLTAEEWREISFRIVPEGRRIRRISFEIDDIDLLVTRHIFGDFIELPVLRKLVLPHSFNGLLDEQHDRTLVIEKMPSIETVAGVGGSNMESEVWDSFVTSRLIYGVSRQGLQKGNLESLPRLPKLRHLILLEDPESQENTPSLPKSSLTSLASFVYVGRAVCRCLTWFGNSLTSLTTTYSQDEDINALLVAVSRFSRLDELTVNIFECSLEPSIQNTVPPENSKNTIKSLTLSCGVEFEANWELVFPVFFAASPGLEALAVHEGFLTDSSWYHIQNVKNLRDLTITSCKTGRSPVIFLDIKSLRNFQWTSDSHGLVELSARLQSQFLQTLCLTESASYRIAAADADTESTILPRYILAGIEFPNVTSLIITGSDSTVWELGSFPRLRELKLQATNEMYSHWASCVLEGILLRPRDNPALEKITLRGVFADWDILLLMLERRNFLNQRGISSVKALVVDYSLPYRLLYPLSELLGGRFVERDSNWSFSLEAIGERLWGASW